MMSETSKTTVHIDPTPIKETTAPVTSSPPTTTATTTPPVANGKSGGPTEYVEDDDDEYEIEYVYEDEEEEDDGEGEPVDVAYEVDDEEDRIPGQRPVVLDEDEEEVEVYEEDEEEEEDAEYDRIANKIDELLSKTSNLKQTDNILPIKTDSNALGQSQPQAPTQISEPDHEMVSQSEVTESAEPTSVGARKPSPPVERASTVEETVELSMPGQLRHVHNQWNISDLHDEQTISQEHENSNKGDQESHPIEPISQAPNLNAIQEEEDGGSDDVSEPKQHSEVRALDRFARSLGDAMADDDEEVNEIEIALEDWNDDQLEEVEEEEDDDNDDVDDQMPDNLLLHANDQIEAIDLPLLTPSPTPSSSPSMWSPDCPSLTRRPISPSSLVLTRMRQMVIAGQCSQFSELVEATPNFFIDAILKAGWTALMYASYRGYPDIVDYCLKRGANPNYHKEFFTSLMAVGSSGATNEGQLLLCMDLLLEHGARVNAVDKFGCSPLHYAARFGRALLTKCLCEHGAKLDHTNRNGWSALHWAAAENHGQVVSTLLDKNIDVLARTKDGVTAGELAAIRNNEEIAKALTEIERSEQQLHSSQSASSPLPVPSTPMTQLLKEEEVKPLEPLEPLQPPQVRTTVRQFSDAEIEARKDEAREIVINAIDAALARDLSKLMGGVVSGGLSGGLALAGGADGGGDGDADSPMPPPTPSGLRKRTLVLGELDEDNESGANAARVKQVDPGAAHNIVMSLALASVIFIILKLLLYYLWS